MFFSVALEMMLGLGLVMYVFTGFGLMIAIAKKDSIGSIHFFILSLRRYYSHYLRGRLQQFLYITKETLGFTNPVSEILPIFIIIAVIINQVNLYIVRTIGKYQKEYTREEEKALKEQQVKLSDLREEVDEEEIAKVKEKEENVEE